eukprot:217157_1
MSDITTSSVDYLDERTHKIIDGYIHDIQKQIPNCYIPKEIKFIMLCFVDDHFMIYRSSYEWIIHNLHQIMSSQPTQAFTSDIFEVCKLKWIIKIYPNGDTAPKANHFLLFIHLLSMPATWSTLLVRIIITCKELDTQCIMIATFTASLSVYNSRTSQCWPEHTLSFTELTNTNPNKLTFTVKIKILQIRGKDMLVHRGIGSAKHIKYCSEVMNYRKNYKFKWVLYPQQLTKFSTHWLPKKRIYSDVLGDLFTLYYVPNSSAASLQICGLPNSKVSALNIKWTLIIDEANIKYSINSKLSLMIKGYSKYSNTVNRSDLLIPSLTFAEFQKYEILTFLLSVEILNEFDAKGNIIGANVEDVWNQYYITKNPNKITKVVPDMKSDSNVSVKKWLSDVVGLEQYSDLLINNGFDSMNALMSLKSKHLSKIGISLMGHRQQILMFVAELIIDNKIRNIFEEDKKNDDESFDKNNEVYIWLTDKVKMHEMYKMFKKEGIEDMETVKSLNYKALIDVGIKRVGDRIKILNEIKKLKKEEKKANLSWSQYQWIIGVCVGIFCALLIRMYFLKE